MRGVDSSVPWSAKPNSEPPPATRGTKIHDSAKFPFRSLWTKKIDSGENLWLGFRRHFKTLVRLRLSLSLRNPFTRA